jgi:hypothetical protein
MSDSTGRVPLARKDAPDDEILAFTTAILALI